MKNLLICILTILAIQDIAAQEIRIPYRQGELWGLADTTGQITTQPVYDKMEFRYWTGKTVFIVENSEGKGVLNNDKILIPAKYSNIKLDYNKYILAVNGDTQDFYDAKGQLLLENLTSFKGVYINNYSFLLVSRQEEEKTYYSIFWYDGELGQIDTFLFKDVKEITWSTEYDFISGVDFDGQETTFEVFKNMNKPAFRKADKKDLENQEVIYAVEEYPPMDQEIIKKTSIKHFEYTFENQNDKLVLTTVFKEREYEQNPKTTIQTIKKEKRTSYQIVDYILLRSIYTDISYKSGDSTYYISNFLISQKKKKYGLVTEHFTLEPQFDSIVGYSRTLQHPFFVGYRFDKKLKKTVLQFINYKGEFLETDNQPIIAYEFKEMGNLFFFTNIEGKKGVYHYNNVYGKLLPIEYDELEYVQGHTFYFVKNGKRGLSFYYKIEVPAIFDDYPSKADSFNQYKVWYMTDKRKNGKFLGYGDLKGFNYYEE